MNTRIIGYAIIHAVSPVRTPRLSACVSGGIEPNAVEVAEQLMQPVDVLDRERWAE